MQLFYPEQQLSALLEQLEAHPSRWLLVCYCAAWCRSCAAFEQTMIDFAAQHPDLICLWVDIETHETLLLEEDLENLPTFLLQKKGQSFFYAPLPPQAGHLERLYEQAQQNLLTPIEALPNLVEKLQQLEP